MLYFSAATGGFYDDAIHRSLPSDARPISRERHAELMSQQGEGMSIIGDLHGDPVAVQPSPPSLEERMAAIRVQRDKHLRDCDHTQLPDFPIDPGQRAAWASYRQELRDLPAAIDNLDQVEWPTPPQQ